MTTKKEHLLSSIHLTDAQAGTNGFSSGADRRASCLDERTPAFLGEPSARTFDTFSAIEVYFHADRSHHDFQNVVRERPL